MRNIARALKSIFLLFNPKTWGPFVEIAEVTRFDHAINVSWSQAGEDIALQQLSNQVRNGKYIDIGAHHPSRFSVTRHLYQLGWSGVNVDANQELINIFDKVRKRDLNICAAVGPKPSYEFTIFEEPAISTFDPEWRDRFLGEKNRIARIVEVEGRTLRAILDDFEPNLPIDLLTIDAEGADFEVLKSIDFETLENARFPKWIFLEAGAPISSALQAPAVKLAMEWGYEPHMVLAMSTLLSYKH